MAATVETIAPPLPARPRVRQTSPAVRLVDRLTTWLITSGGILVIVAVLGIMVYLVTVVWPLFQGATIGAARHYPLFSAAETRDLLFVELDEYQEHGLALDRTGRLTAFDARTGQVTDQRALLPAEPPLTAWARTLRDGHVALGFADGTIRLGTVKFVAGTPQAEFDDPVVVGRPGVPVALLDYKVSDRREVFTVLKQDGELFWDEVTRKENIVTGKVTARVKKQQIPFALGAALPLLLLQNAQGDQLYLAWPDGLVRRFDLRRIDQPVEAETRDLTPDPGAALTDLRFMFGDQSLIASDSHGGVTAWYCVERPQAGTLDGYQLLPAYRLAPHAAPVVRTALSVRDKGLLSATATGEIWLRHLTSEQVLGKVRVSGSREEGKKRSAENPSAKLPQSSSFPAFQPSTIVALQLTPKADGIFAVDAGGNAWLWPVANPHPETTLRTIFGKVWYEGYPEPGYTWQSSSGNDDFEPKFSLVPLIFGTLKATFYSLLFAVPLALLGAIYTSQFLDKKLRAPVKSTIETMASLPSVVLGFIAALVLAPIVENWVVAVLTAFALVPLTVLVFGYFWQLLPRTVRLRSEGWPQFVILVALVVLAVVAARELGGPVERWLFAGDFKAWLDGRVGSGAPGIAVLAWPFALAAVWVGQRRLVADRLRARLRGLGRVQLGLVELARLLAMLAAASALAGLAGLVLAAFGLDPRGPLVGTYVQRNTLVVGFVMGFAVIPIIYTISEDALSSVPEHLRSASLGCGATPWQTAIRVIVPVAMSGIFSAVMIGLGRAVGETMIVVMAAGNTPLLDVNIFNGLRALSANIAVELPEAVKDSTLFRMLFLAALTLFVMTFVVNTGAEIIRMRFRKRAFQL